MCILGRGDSSYLTTRQNTNRKRDYGILALHAYQESLKISESLGGLQYETMCSFLNIAVHYASVQRDYSAARNSLDTVVKMIDAADDKEDPALKEPRVFGCFWVGNCWVGIH